MIDKSQNSLSVFSDSYETARAQFISEANAAGAIIESFKHPSAHCPDGAALFTDTAWLGPRHASNVMIMICGTHGPESFTGAAIQLACLKARKPLASSTAILLIHAINPFGWAHCSRTTENNVDLNRNFIDHQRKPLETDLTKPVQNLLRSSNASGPRFIKIILGLGKLLLSAGSSKLLNEISRGQYNHADGIGFGGHSPEWSNYTLQKILHTHLKSTKRVTIIDWHTGIGDYGQPCFLCFDEVHTPEYNRALHVWGKGIEKSHTNYSSGERPDYQGLLINAARDLAKAAGAQTTTCVIEFGTYSNLKMLKALLIDRWLRIDAMTSRPALKEKMKEQVLRSFYPMDVQWRASVLDHGAKIVSDSLKALDAWEEES
jgi:hypothetical protein